MPTIIETPDDMTYAAAVTVKAALKLLKLGMQPNRVWTPTRVRAKASELTGNRYKRGEYDQPIADLQAMVDKYQEAVINPPRIIQG